MTGVMPLGTFVGEDDRKPMFSAAAELAYLAGWKSFDSGLHGLAQRYYVLGRRVLITGRGPG